MPSKNATIRRFVGSGLSGLGDRLGPLLWPLPETTVFDPDDFAAFVERLPAQVDGRTLRHAVELRHPSFACVEAVQCCRAANVAIVYADSDDYPAIADVTTDFVYARLQRGCDAVPTGYADTALQAWADRCRRWARGEAPADLPLVDRTAPCPHVPRDVFVYFIRQGKRRAPQAAMTLQACVTG